jgi:glycosyltransferase involved in cell wall biosynthesis
MDMIVADGPDNRTRRDLGAPKPRIALDGIFFQYASSGIARVWSALLEEWSKSGFIDHVTLLVRRNSRVAQIAGLRRVEIAEHSYLQTGRDSLALERACRDLNADLFVSTYYTTPTSTPSFFFGYDMIAEMQGLDLTQELWRQKRRAILHSAARLMISQNSARDVERIYNLPVGSTYVAHCGVWSSFHEVDAHEVPRLRSSYDLGEHPYVLLVGERTGFGGYKNGKLLFRAIGRMQDSARYTIVCVGGQPLIEDECRRAASGARIAHLTLRDDELRAAYAGAHAFVYPSRYEGFGMPVIEAMACGAPVITCRNSSLAEIAGDAALFVGEDDIEGMRAAIEHLGDPLFRADLIARGAQQAGRFSFSVMAEKVASALLETHRKLSTGELVRPSAAWQELREIQQDAQNLPTFGRVLMRHMKAAILEALRSVGLDPDHSRLWMMLRALQQRARRSA